MTMHAVRETCQRCEHLVVVDAKGLTVAHRTDGSGEQSPEVWSLRVPQREPWCSRCGHPSREDLARRKQRRADRRAALVAELQPEAVAALDAYLEGRAEYADRIPDFRRAALYALNQRDRTRHQHDVEYNGAGEAGGLTYGIFSCRYCRARLEWRGASRPTASDITSAFRDHLTTCALLFLAGRIEATLAEQVRREPVVLVAGAGGP